MFTMVCVLFSLDPNLLGGEQRVHFEKKPIGPYHEQQQVILKHVYESNNQSETLIDDQYYTLYGMICPLCKCIFNICSIRKSFYQIWHFSSNIYLKLYFFLN